MNSLIQPAITALRYHHHKYLSIIITCSFEAAARGNCPPSAALHRAAYFAARVLAMSGFFNRKREAYKALDFLAPIRDQEAGRFKSTRPDHFISSISCVSAFWTQTCFTNIYGARDAINSLSDSKSSDSSGAPRALWEEARSVISVGSLW